MKVNDGETEELTKEEVMQLPDALAKVIIRLAA